MTSIRELAERTPARRERHIDLLRAVAIGAVVLGHWLVIGVEHDADGRLAGFSALGELTWAHPVTWLFQVMPIFFMVGGYANAASLTAHYRRVRPDSGRLTAGFAPLRPLAADGGTDTGWLLNRSARLIQPTAVLLVVTAVTALGARLAGAPAGQIATAAWLVSIPLWFLVVYLAMIALTPVMHALHRRAGLAAPALLLLPVLVGDGLRFWSGGEVLGWGNFVFAWLAIHQIGFAWFDGRLPTGRGAAALFGGGLAALFLLTVPGPYPVSMVTVPGEVMQNSSPPSLALVALAATQLGLALLVRDASERWLRRRWPWLVVVAMNSVILTMFLWHMSAVVLVALALDSVGLLLTPPVDSGQWLLWQIPWIAILVVVLAGLVAVFGQVETRAAAGRRADPGGPVALVAAVSGYAATLGGLLWIAVADNTDHGPFALPTGALLMFLAGAAVLWLARRRLSSRPAPRSPRAAAA